nr:podocan-like [Ciona intestinalis]|eukprot:XP_018668363.1 podocan-like [Ciona intestinalis]
MEKYCYVTMCAFLWATALASYKVGSQTEYQRLVFKGDGLACPDSCHCSSPERVDCSEADLQFVPSNISGSTVYLILTNNKLEALSSECFTECPLVQTLDLQWNMISEEGLPPSTFAPLSNLYHLILSNNRLRKVPAGLPDSLLTLHLAGNEIKRIDPAALALKSQLRNLYLHNNRLADDGIRRGIFRSLRKLVEMTLSSNQITRMPLIPDSAEMVYLQNNSLQELPPGTFRHKRNVRVLFLQRNNISSDGIKRKSFAGLRGVEYLDLSRNSLREIPHHLPRSLNRLHLEGNEITRVSRNATSRLKKLKYLLLHQNNIRSGGIESGALRNLHNLHTLRMFGNHLTEIPEPLPKRIHCLILLNNKIRSISNKVFQHTRTLQELDLRYNKLTNKRIARGTFRKLKSANRIDLSGNQLRAVPGLPRNVTTLLLNRNHIKKIPLRSFSRMPYLKQLGMADNRIRSEGIPLNAFKVNTNIQVLDLSSNELVRLPRFFPPNVEYLYLQNNKITEIRKMAFFSAPKLKGIFLQDNLLLPETVFRSAFTGLKSLHRVEISWRPLEPNASNAKTLNRKKRDNALPKMTVFRQYKRRRRVN